MKSFKHFHDAVFEAHFYAFITRYRYKVRYDAGNKNWQVIETVDKVEEKV